MMGLSQLGKVAGVRSAAVTNGNESVIAIDADAVSPDAVVDRATRRGVGLLLAFLVTHLLLNGVANLADGVRGTSLVVLVALRALGVLPQLVHSLPRFRQIRARYWRWTFTIQALLTFVPHFAFGARWASGGLLAGSALLLFRAPTSWLVSGLVVAGEGGFLLAYGLDPGWTLVLVADGAAVIGLAVFVLTRLVDVLGELHATRVATARAEAARERLRAAREVFGRLGPHLSMIARAAEQARRIAGTDPASADAAVAGLGEVVRRTLSKTREAARTFRDAGPDGAAKAASVRAAARTASAEARQAYAVIVVMSLTGAGANLVGIVTHQRPGPNVVVFASAGLAVLVAFQIYHGAPRADGAPPRGRWWTLSAQILLVYLPVPIFGMDWIGMTSYLAACVLAVLRPPASWLLFGGIIATLPPILAALSGQAWFMPDRWWSSFWFILATLWTVLIFRGPMLLAASAVQLRTARNELIRVLLTQERLGVARDVHDLLGSSLSAVALKADLAQRLLHRDVQRAQAELADAADLAHRAITEARSLSDEEPDTSLSQELASARSILAAASIRADITPFPSELPTRTDAALAIVVREAVTNVLRHSIARHCTINCSLDGDSARLRITNDGAGLGTRAGTGTGIGNLRARIHALGGQLSAVPNGEHGFGLLAEVPLNAISR
jgi:two-component system, NarL family, sensor histidine kinase DesK